MTTVTPSPEKLLLSQKEAAAMLSISPRTLFSLTKPNGPIPFVRISRGGKRYALSDLQRFIDEQRRG